MILILEIAMLVTGIKMLITGRGFTKDVPPDRRFRVLGAFLVVLLPLDIALMFTLAVVWAMTHPNVSPDQLVDQLRWVTIAIEVGMAVIWAITWAIWEKSIVRKLKAAAPSMPPATLPATPPIMREQTLSIPDDANSSRR